MTYQAGFWTDLGSVKFEETGGSEDSVTTTFMAMPYGEYDHPVYGKVSLTLDRARRFALNVANKVRGIDLDIDYDHKTDAAMGSRAAGWVKAAEARSNGLYLTVKWTKAAWESIKAGEWRYFSPEFTDEWKHPQTGEVHKDVLLGGGITNRPFLKNILPLNMSELFAEGQAHTEEGKGMDPKMRKLLGLPEDCTQEQYDAALAAIPDDATISTPEGAGGGGGEGEGSGAGEGAQGTPQLIAASEGNTEEVIKRLSESTDPNVKALAEVAGALMKTVQVQGTALKLAETNNVVNTLAQPKDGKILPATVLNEFQTLLLNSPSKQFSDGIIKMAEAMRDTAGVKATETGDQQQHNEGDGESATMKFAEKVDEIMKAEAANGTPMSFADASILAAEKHPELFEGHRSGSYAWREN